MALVLQILLAILLLLGFVALYLSSKNWHWTQITLLTFIMLISVGFMILAANVVRIHRAFRSKMPDMQLQLANFETKNERLLRGAGDEAGIIELQHRLQMITRERGRAWRNVVPAGGFNVEGNVEVTIPAPTPHGMEEKSVVYAFEMGDPNPANPAQGAQYLGEFEVVESQEGGVVLSPVKILDQRTGERIDKSRGPWNLYESMPADRYNTFAGMDEEELRRRLPASVIPEYLHHGQEATEDDNPENVVGYDENDVRLSPDEMGRAVRKIFNRPLRDYDYLFSELGKEMSIHRAKREALIEDNKLWENTLASAERLSEFRQQELNLLESDLTGMKQDRTAIEAHLQIVQKQLANASKLIEEYLATNASLAQELTQRETALRQMINAVSPAPATTFGLP